MSKDQVIYMLNRIPTTEIVRCEDCKYKGKVGDVSVCRIHEISTHADDYCSRGERSERMADRPCKFAINTSGDCWKFADDAIRPSASDFCSYGERREDKDYERAIEQIEHDTLYESTYNPEDGSM